MTTLPTPAAVVAGSPPTAVRLHWSDPTDQFQAYNLEELGDMLLNAADIPVVLEVLKTVDDHLAGEADRPWTEFQMLEGLDRRKLADLVRQLFHASFSAEFADLLTAASAKLPWLRMLYLGDSKLLAVGTLLGFLEELATCDRIEFIHLR